MSDLCEKLTERDLHFMIETLLPERRDVDYLVGVLREDKEFFRAMLGADRLFQRFATDREILVKVSPRLYFAVLLQQVSKDLRKATFTIERSQRQRLPVFDTDKVASFLASPEVPDYLADMLSSFTKVESYAVAIRVRHGIWHRLRFSDMDIDGLIRYCQVVEEPQRFAYYKRIGDVCLFLAGIFPEYIHAQDRYPWSEQRRPRFLGQRRRTMDEYRDEGSAFYERAAQHELAGIMALGEILAALAEHFLEAQKALAYMAERYLWVDKQQLFAVG